MKRLALSALFFVLAVALGAGSYFLANAGFQRVLDFRILERIPETYVLASTGGEVQLRGAVAPIDTPLESPDTKSPSVYYRYLIEEEVEDSDGDKSWRTVSDDIRSVDFWLNDGTGRAAVRANRSQNRIDWSTQQKFQERRGDYRYTEWRIDVGDIITLFGWMELGENPGDAQVRFDAQGSYLPIISGFSDRQERQDRNWTATTLIALSSTLMIFAMYLATLSLRIHRVLKYLGLVMVSTAILLAQLGWRSAGNDVRNGFERVNAQYERSAALIAGQIDTNGGPFDFDLRQSAFSTLTEPEKTRLNGWRLTAWQVRERYLKQVESFPESWIARGLAMNDPPPVQLPRDQLEVAEKTQARYEETSLGRLALLSVAALLLTTLGAWLAFRVIRVKRMQENLPTCNTAGVVFGITELSGTLSAEEDLLEGPLSGESCSWYRYQIRERRGSGKNASWHTILDETHGEHFWCEDDEGRLRVYTKDAEIITRHSIKESRSRQRHREWRLEPGDTLYLLGQAGIDPQQEDRLAMQQDDEAPFIISNLSEREVMLKKASLGLGLMGASISALFFALIVIAGSGGFASLDFFLAALATPLFFTILIVIMMYNDLIFLRERARRAWANIQVSLKKRADLLPQLQRSLKALMEHERPLLEQLTAMRSLAKSDATEAEVGTLIREEQQFLASLQVTAEAYPELKTDEAFRRLSTTMSELETEIAMMRAGFNDAVEYYNTRIASLPDLFLARLGRLKPMEFLR